MFSTLEVLRMEKANRNESQMSLILDQVETGISTTTLCNMPG